MAVTSVLLLLTQYRSARFCFPLTAQGEELFILHYCLHRSLQFGYFSTFLPFFSTPVRRSIFLRRDLFLHCAGPHMTFIDSPIDLLTATGLLIHVGRACQKRRSRHPDHRLGQRLKAQLDFSKLVALGHNAAS